MKHKYKCLLQIYTVLIRQYLITSILTLIGFYNVPTGWQLRYGLVQVYQVEYRSKAIRPYNVNKALGLQNKASLADCHKWFLVALLLKDSRLRAKCWCKNYSLKTTTTTGCPLVLARLAGHFVLCLSSFGREATSTDYIVCPYVWLPVRPLLKKTDINFLFVNLAMSMGHIYTHRL